MTVNVVVPGLSDRQRAELEALPGADQMRFHSLLDVETLTAAPHFDLESLLDRAREELATLGRVDAIVAHWDFPTSILVPILAMENSIPSPSLKSFLTCEHKYWSRLMQAEAVPECVPDFAAFDPFDDDPLSGIEVAFPFWVKPVKSHSSQLGFEIHDADEFYEAVAQIRREITVIGDAFNQALGMVDLPPEIERFSGNSCLAEQIISGRQVAPEGSMYRGEFITHGVFDMRKSSNGLTFDRLDYPAGSVGDELIARMLDVSERYLRHIGFDNGCFNVEFMWDDEIDKLWVIEVNTRISQSHSELFLRVDGTSNHEYAIDVALGRRPEPGSRRGPYRMASKCLLGRADDGVVTSTPTQHDLARLRAEEPGCTVEVDVQPGDRLSELPNQDPYRYVLATVYVGGQEVDDLEQAYERASELLPFTFE
ncbi:acetyl-CoA carboxylase biotin carboxylase subunit family protein [Gordonia sp. PS3]|uniref:ATP-grasp domain-containing protein n=2 Tax=Gordonia sihwensis TaxID=173559 RepID=L7LP85_9ACTN|nr:MULTISPECIES: ATP-grasp domain-containing protein [Gordonia]AUH67457.1 ATP-grasp domain-containing protein [Gordonia sp. YC-JH1]KXT57041.1 hypothetical protein Y710_11205 [Gordonia sp. QH-12]WFN92886.1 ATP-grasp domain-containing protein [Gordonia sihwensis]GAC62511.1 hypothetical protein GSI01S_36_00060 [Gordonia sihwensis NBRC 108236]